MPARIAKLELILIADVRGCSWHRPPGVHGVLARAFQPDDSMAKIGAGIGEGARVTSPQIEIRRMRAVGDAIELFSYASLR